MPDGRQISRRVDFLFYGLALATPVVWVVFKFLVFPGFAARILGVCLGLLFLIFLAQSYVRERYHLPKQKTWRLLLGALSFLAGAGLGAGGLFWIAASLH